MTEKPHIFEVDGQQLVGMLHLPDGESPAPAVVVLHGFADTKAGRNFMYRTLARKMCAGGYVVYRFDFRGSGDSAGEFEEMTFQGQIADALGSLEMLEKLPQIDGSRLGIVGRSFGGCVAACVAAECSDVRSIALWSAPSDLSAFANALPDPRKHPDAYPLEAVPLWPGIMVGRGLAEGLPLVRPLEQIAKSSADVLILQGSEDQIVPVAASDRYEKALSGAGNSVRRHMMEGTAHSYLSAAEQREVVDTTAKWFDEKLRDAEAAKKEQTHITYADSGVDIATANETKRRIADTIRSTFGPEVVSDIGTFGGLFAPDLSDIDDPVLVASTDSVGTKLKVAFMTSRHETVGQCLVNHCVNDILVQGAKPLFFQDYIGIGRHESEVVVDLIKGVAEGCRLTGTAALGGEMAELPGFYRDGEYDLAGTIVGVVDRKRIVDGTGIGVGDMVLGLASDGLHTNGYSLARKLLFDVGGYQPDQVLPELGRTVADELLAVHRSYAGSILPLCREGVVNGLAHITGGGLLENIPRVLPSGVGVEIAVGSWPRPPIFKLLTKLGNLHQDEAHRTFNMGVGMVVIVSEKDSGDVAGKLEAVGETVWPIGHVVNGDSEVRLCS